MTADQNDRTRLAMLIDENPAAAYTVGASGDWAEGLARLIPEHMQAGMARHVLLGVRPGSFLSAVLDNDLMEAAKTADDINRFCLHDYAKFLYNFAPSESFGSPENAAAWQERGGLLGHTMTGEDQC